MNKVARTYPLVTGLLLGVSLTGNAYAQDSRISPANESAQDSQIPPAEEPAVDEILVTATRRAESLQAVPLSISALSSEALEKNAATSFIDYATSIPNLAFGSTGQGAVGSRTISIRGIADASTTGFYVDETPLPESIDPRVVDVQRIEVLRGPQGTLYGARSMGGTVRIITEQPDLNELNVKLHGQISGTRYGGANYLVDGAGSVPLVDGKVAFRVAGLYDYESGFMTRQIVGPVSGNSRTVDNIARSETTGFSAALLIKPTESFDLTPRVLHQHTSLNGLPYADVVVNPGTSEPLKPTTLVQTRPFDIPEPSSDDWTLYSVEAKLETSIGSLVSSTSYFDRKGRNTEDFSLFAPSAFGIAPLPGVITIKSDYSQFAQEVRFVSDFSSKFHLVAGGFYLKSRERLVFPPANLPGFDTALGGPFGTDLIIQSDKLTHTEEKAIYAEARYDLTSSLHMAAGLRGFDTSVDARQTATGIALGGNASFPTTRIKQSGVTPKFQIQYTFDRENQLFATAAKGFRPGGINGLVPTALGCSADLANLGVTAADAALYKSDSLWSYEAGAKTSWFNRALTVNASGFYIKWSNIQQRIVLPTCGFSFRGNAGEAVSKGFELEATARPTRDLTLNLGIGYSDTNFTEGSSSSRFQKGDRVPQVPRWTLTAAADYEHPISDTVDGFLHAEYSYVGSSTSVTNAIIDPVTGRVIPRIRPSYDLVDARLGLKFGRYEVALFGKNLTDTRANLSDSQPIAAETVGLARVVINRPRTIGIEGRIRY